MVVLGFLAMVSHAMAGPGVDGVSAAREALLKGDTERASMLLVQARQNLPKEDQILMAADVASLLYLEGLAPRVAGLDRERDVEKWRDALTVFPALKWDREIHDDKALRGYFEALRSEVAQREPVPTGVPAKRGLLKAYVDGVEHRHLQAVRSGIHLIQVQCPDGAVRGEWHRFDEPVDWLSLCPGPIDVSVVAPEEVVDEFALDDPDPKAGPEPLGWVEPTVPVAPRQPFRIPSDTLWVSAGVAGTVSLIAYSSALMARGKYDKTDPPEFNAVSELEAQRRKTNRLVTVSGGFFVLAAGLSAGAMVGGEF